MWLPVLGPHLASLRSAAKCNPTESHPILFKIVKSPPSSIALKVIKHGGIFSVWLLGMSELRGKTIRISERTSFFFVLLL